MLDLARDINPMRAEIAALKSRLQRILASLDEQAGFKPGAPQATSPMLNRPAPAQPAPLLNQPALGQPGTPRVTVGGAPSPLRRR
jgi:hypothetical protein